MPPKGLTPRRLSFILLAAGALYLLSTYLTLPAATTTEYPAGTPAALSSTARDLVELTSATLHRDPMNGPYASGPFTPQDPRWAAIRRIFGQEGKEEEGYFRVEFPRTDLRVRIGEVRLEPEFELTSYFGFAPVGADGVLAMGEVILLQEEVTGTLTEARRQGVYVTALHNHLIGETPRIMYLHLMAEGPADSVASKLRSVITTTGAPLRRAAEPETAPVATPDWSAIDAILGPHSEASGSTAEYIFPRREDHAVHGIPVKSTDMLETASEVVFQRLADGRMACGGELYLRPGEVQPVLDALEGAGLHVTALHNHMLDEEPAMYWMHWYGTGEGATLARGVAAALAQMNSARRTEAGSD